MTRDRGRSRGVCEHASNARGDVAEAELSSWRAEWVGVSPPSPPLAPPANQSPGACPHPRIGSYSMFALCCHPRTRPVVSMATPKRKREKECSLSAVVLSGGEEAELCRAALAIADLGVPVRLPQILGHASVSILEHHHNHRRSSRLVLLGVGRCRGCREAGLVVERARAGRDCGLAAGEVGRRR